MHDLMEHRPDTRKLWVSKLYSLEKKKKLQDGWIVDGEDEIATMWRTD